MGSGAIVTMHDDYKRLEIPPGVTLRPCPVCGADAELWQFSKSETAATNKLGMCSNGDAIGPQDGLVNEGCLLFMPPEGFYQATIREGVRFWNEYADALEKVQRANRWKRVQVLREGRSDTP
jgi:hypothetical protein